MKSVFPLFFSFSLSLPVSVYILRSAFGFVSSGDMPAATMFSKFKSGTATQNQNTNYIDSNPIVQHFEISKQTACAGPELIWKIHDGFKKSDGRVSIYHFSYYSIMYRFVFVFAFCFYFVIHSFCGFMFARSTVCVRCLERKQNVVLYSTQRHSLTHKQHAVRGNEYNNNKKKLDSETFKRGVF